MKISEVIQELQDILKTEGDLECYSLTEFGEDSIEVINVYTSNTNTKFVLLENYCV